MNKTYKIQSLSDYIEQINQITLESDIRTYPPKLLFRGQSKDTYDLVPALGRYPSSSWGNSWQMVERGLIQAAQQKFPMLFPATDYPAILLAKLQHYGIYTRMLDLTANALVALYFACKNHLETDGEVLAFSAQTLSAYDAYVSVVADTYRLTGNAYIGVDTYYYRASHQQYYSSAIYPDNLEHKERLLDNFLSCVNRPMFVEVGNVCERQKNQDGYFLLLPNEIKTWGSKDGAQKKIEDKLVKLSKDNDPVVRRLIIPKELKQELRRQISRFGVTDEFLFADSVDEVCRSIIEEYRTHYPD